MKFRYVLILLMWVLILAACNTPAETAALAATSTPLPPTDLPTETVAPTTTQTPTLTKTPTQTATATATFTPSPTPFTGFEQSQLNNHEARSDYYLFVFRVPGIGRNYFAKIENQPFQCKFDEKYPDVLACVGDYFEFTKDYIKVAFYEDETAAELVYENSYFSGPTKPAYTIVYAGPETWCPARGEGLNCETEYREYDGEGCVASTCYDDCGYYYSIDTCPYTSDEFRFIAGP